MNKIRVAFIKFGGLSAGGTERWLQMMAAHLPKDDFEIDYYYCAAAPYVGSDDKHASTDPDRLRYMQEHQANLVEFHVGAKDVTKPTHDWIDTDFWKVFDPRRYDLVQTAKAGPAEYPYFLIDKPIIEYVTLLAGVDHSPNIARSIHLSQWQRAGWFRRGGDPLKSAVIPIPADPPTSTDTLRRELNIPETALVAGFHQRNDDRIASPIPLSAFAAMRCKDHYFVIMGGGPFYRRQVHELGLRNVRFVDHSGDTRLISTFLNTLDLFAHGRKDGETFGTVFAEAMMHGLPCLSHAVRKGANAQKETMGPAGLFAQDLQDYTRKMERLFNDEPFRKALRSKARRHAEEYYSLERALKDLAAIYAETLGRTASSRERETSYGLSPLGFLYAGEINTPGTIAHHVITGEIPEEAEIHLMRFFLPRVDSFFDIGANTGLYGFVAAQEGCAGMRIVLFEPQAECCEQMQRTVWLNNWEDRVTIACLGLGNHTGDMALHLSGTGSTLDNAFNDQAALPIRAVRVDTLDHQTEALGISKVGFIKIDTEGFEQAVLEGGRRTIERDKPILFIEIADRLKARRYRNPNYAKTLEWLADRGYGVWRCTESGRLEKAFPIRPQPHLSMYVALHAEKDGHLIVSLERWMRSYRWNHRWARLKKMAWLAARGLRHPRNAYGGLLRYLRNRSYGIRF